MPRTKLVRMCRECGSPIPPQRLEALPDTRSCVRCSCERCRSVYDVLDGPLNEDMVNAVHDIPSGE